MNVLKQKKSGVFGAVVLLFVLAFALRLLKATYMVPFGEDQARDITIVLEHLSDRKPFVLGPKASAGNFFVHPLYYYLLTVPVYLTNGNPAAVQYMIAFFDSLTVVVLFASGYLLSKKLGLITALLYAVSPYTVGVGGTAWSPHLIPLLSACVLYGVLRTFLKNDHTWIMLSIVSAVMAFEMHFQGAILLMMLGVLYVYSYFTKHHSKYWYIGGFLSLLTFLPFLFDLPVFLNNLQSITHFMFVEQKNVFQTVRTIPFFWNNMPGFVSEILGMKAYLLWFDRLLLYGSLGCVGVLALFDVYRKKSTVPVLLSLLIGSAFVFLRVYKGDKLHYYMLFLIPFIFYLFGYVYMLLEKTLIGRLAAYVTVVLLFFSMGLNQPYLNKDLRGDESRRLKTLVSFMENRGTTQYTLLKSDVYYYGVKLLSQQKQIQWYRPGVAAPSVTLVCNYDSHCRCLSSSSAMSPYLRAEYMALMNDVKPVHCSRSNEYIGDASSVDYLEFTQ